MVLGNAMEHSHRVGADGGLGLATVLHCTECCVTSFLKERGLLAAHVNTSESLFALRNYILFNHGVVQAG